MIPGESYGRAARERFCYEFSCLIQPIFRSRMAWSGETRIGRSVPLRVHGTCTMASRPSSLRRTPGRVGVGGGPSGSSSSAEGHLRSIEGARRALATRRRPAPATTLGSGSHRFASGSPLTVAFGQNGLLSTSPNPAPGFLGLHRSRSIAAPFWRCHMPMTSRRDTARTSRRKHPVRRGGVE